MTGEEISLAKVFKDAEEHKEITAIIQKHMEEKVDIRELSLDEVDLSSAANILDIGCGNGFFTESLKGRVHPEAKITGIDRFPEYEWFYFQACSKAGLRAGFRNNGIHIIEEYPDNVFDLVICSFALYFFPEVIPQVARILKPGAPFITITHDIPHMVEFSDYVRSVIKKEGLIVTTDLPYEELISRFSDRNGKPLLEPHFASVRQIRHEGRLIFGEQDHEALIRYFNFKHSFFIPMTIDPDDDLHKRVAESIRYDLQNNRGMAITKNDSIFVCTND